ncbi:hypothetical protein [Qipengyuania zhejiangensis]|uniref:hypothetical protein n=1 Tax=Qipengyuania zhejiangensis TaxID=3077782 RepID=UPI002D78E53A|nr:hypothetical protein [Qipengyuania sp. Z2]
MATQPEPDIITPGSPDEYPQTAPPNEAPMTEPPGVDPVQPDFDDPGRGPEETPAPSD